MRRTPPRREGATPKALNDFFSGSDALIRDAIVKAQEHHRESHQDRRAELDTVEAGITAKMAAVDRYLAAFEAGTLDDDTTGERAKTLKQDLIALKTRRDEITT